jgi:hypothetical protein
MTSSLAAEQRRLALAASLTRQIAAGALTDAAHPDTTFDPPYPGVRVREDERRVVFACRAFRDDGEVGTVFTTLIEGRKPSVSVAPPGTPFH